MPLPRPILLARLTARLAPVQHTRPRLSTTAAAFSTSTRLYKQHASDQPTPPPKPARKPPRKANATNSSLRSVAAQATIVKSHINPSAPTKLVTAYCAAETYDMATAARLVAAEGYTLDPFNTALFPQVIHVQTSSGGDIFVFPSGTLVAWDVPETEALRLVKTTLPPAAEGSHLDLLETEDLEYLEDAARESSKVIGDTIILGTKPPSPSHSPTTPPTASTDAILTKIAFSSGLARSTKLAVLESLLATYQHSTRLIPATLSSSSSHPPFTRSFILRKTGDLLSIRAQLNLYSELTDAMPDMFWDADHSLNLGGCYDALGRALDVGARIRVLNDKIGFAQEIAAVLREQLSEKHGLRLEWAIIALIAVEVVLECYRHWDERREREGEGSTEVLLRRYLVRMEEKEREKEAKAVSV